MRAVCAIAGVVLGVIVAVGLVFLLGGLLDLVGIDAIVVIWVFILVLILAIPAGALMGALIGGQLGTRLTDARRESDAQVTRHWGARR